MPWHNGSQQTDSPRRYLVEFTEPALVDADAAYLSLSERAGPEQKEQAFYCHFECFRGIVADDSILCIAEQDYSTNTRRDRERPNKILWFIVNSPQAIF